MYKQHKVAFLIQVPKLQFLSIAIKNSKQLLHKMEKYRKSQFFKDLYV